MKLAIVYLTIFYVVSLIVLLVTNYLKVSSRAEQPPAVAPTKFMFFRAYGHVRDNTWEELDNPMDISTTDVFRIYEQKTEYMENLVPYALPVAWDGEAFVYNGIWPVKNKGR